MFEILIPLGIGAAGIVPKFIKWAEKSDKQKINIIFKNVGIAVKQGSNILYPQFQRKESLHDTSATKYIYTIPLGMPSELLKKLDKILTDGLHKPVKIEYRKVLEITVYDKDLPELVKFKDVPIKAGWSVPIGKNLDGWVYHNFDKTPHMTVAGTTRFGKTVMLKHIMTYLSLANPEHVKFIIIDLKGGLEFEEFKDLKQVLAVASNPKEALDVLMALEGKINEHYQIFKSRKLKNIVDTDEKDRVFIIVDEAAQLAPERWMKKEMKDMLGACQYILSEITRIAGGLGYREIFCTQYPTSDTIPRQIKQNSDAKVSFRLPTGYASEVAIDDRGAEELPSDVPGRAIFKTHEMKRMQVPFITDSEMRELLSPYVECKESPKAEPPNGYSTDLD